MVKLTYSFYIGIIKNHSAKSIMIDFSKSYNPLIPQIPQELFSHIYSYDDSDYLELKSSLAKTFKKDSANVIVDNASSAVIEKILSHYYDSVIFCENDFFVFDNIAAAYHQKIEKIPRLNFLQNLDVHLSKQRGNRLVLFSIVNNYESSLLNLVEIYKIAKKYPRISFILDGAYFEYTGLLYSSLDEILSLPNVSYMATFSKAYGLAGLRVGYLISNQIEKFYPIEIKYKVASLSCRLANYLLNDKVFFNQTIEHFKEEKEKFVNAGFIATDAHKVLYICEDIEKLTEHLKKNNISALPIILNGTQLLAFSISSTQNNNKLINAINNFF